MSSSHADVVVVGAGPAGSVAAPRAGAARGVRAARRAGRLPPREGLRLLSERGRLEHARPHRPRRSDGPPRRRAAARRAARRRRPFGRPAASRRRRSPARRSTPPCATRRPRPARSSWKKRVRRSGRSKTRAARSNCSATAKSRRSRPRWWWPPTAWPATSTRPTALRPAADARLARRGRCDAGRRPAFYDPGRVFMATAPGGYVGLVRVEDGRLDVAAASTWGSSARRAASAAAAAAVLESTGWPVPPGLERTALARDADADAAAAGGGRAAAGSPSATRPGTSSRSPARAWPGRCSRPSPWRPCRRRAVRGWDDAHAAAWAADARRRSSAAASASAALWPAAFGRRALAGLAVRLLALFPALSRPLVAGLNRSALSTPPEAAHEFRPSHGLGTATPPDAVPPEDGLGIARVLAGPDVRTSDWLGPVYSGSGIRQRYQVIGGQVIRDVLDGTRVSGSAFLPTAANDGIGPTTGERMKVYAAEAGPLALRAAAGGRRRGGVRTRILYPPRHRLLHRLRRARRGPRPDPRARPAADGGADARRLHGLPRGAQRAARGRRLRPRRPGRAGAAVRGGAVQPALLLRQRGGQAGRQRDLRRRRGGRGRAWAGRPAEGPKPCARDSADRVVPASPTRPRTWAGRSATTASR